MNRVIDHELALKRANGNEELAAELHQMLLASLPQNKTEIEQAWASGDRTQLVHLVHKLNGSTRYCGTPQLEEIADTLEGSLKANSAEVEVHYAALLTAVDNLLS